MQTNGYCEQRCQSGDGSDGNVNQTIAFDQWRVYAVSGIAGGRNGKKNVTTVTCAVKHGMTPSKNAVAPSNPGTRTMTAGGGGGDDDGGASTRVCVHGESRYRGGPSGLLIGKARMATGDERRSTCCPRRSFLFFLLWGTAG